MYILSLYARIPTAFVVKVAASLPQLALFTVSIAGRYSMRAGKDYVIGVTVLIQDSCTLLSITHIARHCRGRVAHP